MIIIFIILRVFFTFTLSVFSLAYLVKYSFFYIFVLILFLRK
jgi:hypothetical protein